MIVKRVGALSLAKVAGILYAIMGLIIGCVFALVSLVGAAIGSSQESPVLGVIFGVGAVFFLPIFYGLIGFLGSLIMAGLFNFVVRLTGGVEIEIEGTSTAGVPRLGV